MGLFDYINCKYPLPKPSFDLDYWKINLNELEYQTKDLENFMCEYTIRENGELWYNDKKYKWVDDDNSFLKGYMEVESSEEKPANFHGVLEFYCYEDLGEKDGIFYNLQLDYNAKFVDNKIVEMKLVKEELEDVTEYKEKMKEYFKKEEIKRNKWYNKYFLYTMPVLKVRKLIRRLLYKWYQVNQSFYHFLIRYI